METCKKLKWTQIQHIDIYELNSINCELGLEPFEMLHLNTVFDNVAPCGVILFGKVRAGNQYKSISVIVENVWKTVYFKKELWEFCEEHLDKYKEQGVIGDYFVKECRKKIFANMKTAEVECVKVKFCSQGLAVKNAFSENLYFGYKTDNVENALLKLGLDGPSWLKISDFSINSKHLTNSKIEIKVESLKSVKKLEKNEEKLENPEKNEEKLDIIILTDTWEGNQYTGIEFKLFKNVEISEFSKHTQATYSEKLTCPGSFSNEKTMINFFLMKIFVADPDIVLTPKNFLSKFVKKCRNIKVKNWSRIGKIIRNKMPNEFVNKKVSLGRIFYEDEEFEFMDIENFYGRVVEDRVLEVAWMLAKVTGMDLEKSLNGGILQKVEFLIIKELHKDGFLWPEKVQKEDEEKFKFVGGLVLEPKPGLYRNIITLDFISLYPSIIQEFKICPTGENLLSQVLSILQQKRSYLIQCQNSSASDQHQLNLQQKSLKHLSNSLYGCFSSQYFRFYMPEISEKTAYHGRQILIESSNLVSTALSLNVIYGDTDSLFVESGVDSYESACELGKFVEEMINLNYNCVKIRTENIFSKFFIMQKKNYAGVKAVGGELVVKGLIRGNNSEFFQEFVKKCLGVLTNYGFLAMNDLVLRTIKDLEESKDGNLVEKNGKYRKIWQKLEKNQKFDWKWHVDKEILPFRNKVKQILSPDNSIYVLCPRKHKIYLFQDLQVVMDCKECANSFNISWDYSENVCKNIVTLSLKQKIQELYKKPLRNKDKMRVPECNLLDKKCFRLTKHCSLGIHYCEFQQFNDYVKNVKLAVKDQFDVPALDDVYSNSSFHVVDLRPYATQPQYFQIIQSLK